jgi:phosphate transport system substrate-binding protein
MILNSNFRGGLIKKRKKLIGETKKMNTKKICKRLVKDASAVSPIIATLMLVLVAVGSAGAFYVWQSGWQENTTDNLEDTDMRTSLLLGGSSTVYPVTVDAAEAFMEEFPQFNIETKGGGSDSGIIGVGEGILHIGAASKNPSSDDFEKYPDLTVTTIGYDGVVIITSGGHDLVAINATTLKAIYAYNGGLDPDYDLNGTGLNASGEIDDNYFEWNEIPTYPTSPDNCTGGTIKVYERADKSGTEECFGEKLLDKEFGKQFSFSGAEHGESIDSNQDLIDGIKNDDNAIGFMAYGIAKDTDGIKMIQYAPYHASGYSDGEETTTDYSSENGSGIPNFADIGSGVYKGSRPLNYLTIGEPTGLAAKYIQFVLWTQNNKDFLHNNAYVSIYD